MKLVALAIAFIINFLLLFYKASEQKREEGEDNEEAESSDSDADEAGSDVEEDESDSSEWIHVDEHFYYIEYIIFLLGLLHALISIAMLIAYYNLKVKTLSSVPFTPLP